LCLADQAGANFRARRDAGMFTPGGILQTVYNTFGPFSGNIGIAPGGGGLGGASGTLMTAEEYGVPVARTYNLSMALQPALALSNATSAEPKKGGSKPVEMGNKQKMHLEQMTRNLKNIMKVLLQEEIG